MTSGHESRAKILIVDDSPSNIAILMGILKDSYRVTVAINGSLALQLAQSEDAPDLILLDVVMPEMDGYQVCRRLKSNMFTAKIPIIFITAKSEIEDEQYGFDLGAVDYITKPISPAIVKARIRAQLRLHDQAKHLESLVKERTSELSDTRTEIIRRLSRAAEFKNNETGNHIIRMSLYSRILAEEAGQPEPWCELIHQASPMHDIGKIGIPDRVLLKPGKLDTQEWEIMKRHASYGAEIIGDHPSPLLQMAKEIALTHHEHWDGSGYPNGLQTTDIPLSGRIVAITDVFDALTTNRPYKKPWSEEQTVAYLQEHAGQHFDPTLVEAFIRCLPRIRKVQQQFDTHFATDVITC